MTTVHILNDEGDSTLCGKPALSHVAVCAFASEKATCHDCHAVLHLVAKPAPLPEPPEPISLRISDDDVFVHLAPLCALLKPHEVHALLKGCRVDRLEPGYENVVYLLTGDEIQAQVNLEPIPGTGMTYRRLY